MIRLQRSITVTRFSLALVIAGCSLGFNSCNAAEKIVLANPEIIVTLDAKQQYLPVSIKTAKGVELCDSGKVLFDVYMRILHDNGKQSKHYERNGGFFGIAQHHKTNLESVVISKGGTCNVTRTIRLPKRGARLEVLYEVEAVKPFTIGYSSWRGLALGFPLFTLSPTFDQSFNIAFKNHTLVATVLPQPPTMRTQPPYWSPIFAASSQHKFMLSILPTVMKNCAIIPSGTPVLVPARHKFTVGFSVEVKPRMTAEAITNWLHKNDQGVLRTGLGQNLYIASKLARKNKQKALAKSTIVEAAKRTPRDVYLLNTMGYIGQDNGDVMLSVDGWYRAALLETSNPRFAEWGVNVMLNAIQKKLLPKEKLNNALALTTERLKRHPKDAMLRATHAKVYAGLANFRMAAQHMKIALREIKGTKQDQAWRTERWRKALKGYQKKNGTP